MLDSICIVIYFAFVITWVLLLFIGSSRHKSMIEPLDRKKYLFKDFYGVGFQILEILKSASCSNSIILFIVTIKLEIIL